MRRERVSIRGSTRSCRMRRCRQASQWLKVVGPGVIVLGLSLGGGEFLLGPDRVRPLRPVASLDHARRGVLPDDLQHRADALHARDRRAGLYRLHAHASRRARSGRGCMSACICCRSGWPYSAGLSAGAIFFLATRPHCRSGRRLDDLSASASGRFSSASSC